MRAATTIGLFMCVAASSLPFGCRAQPGATPEGANAASERRVKPAWAAGKFYPADPGAVRRAVEGHLNQVNPPSLDGRIVGVVAPHAGYDFSGPVAGMAFAPLRGASYDLVVIVGPSHRVAVRGAALSDADVWRTPLGDVPVDRAACRALSEAWAGAQVQPAAFAQEHSVEVELPFLQVALEPGFKILPLVMTDFSMANCRALADALIQVVRGRRALLVASSDLSHYPAYADAQKADKAALEAVLALDAARVEQTCRKLETRGVPGLVTAMCGRGPVQAVILACKGLGARRAVLLGSANSADAASDDKSQVVGYGAVAFLGPAQPAQGEETRMDRSDEAKQGAGLSDAQRSRLLKIARETLERFVREAETPQFEESDPALTRPSGAFVTLWKEGELRGCIGMIEAKEPLYLTVRDMAIASASQDNRFPPVSAAELPRIHVEINVLSPPRQVSDASEIVVGKHGVIVKQGWRQGVFLPEVATQQGWNREQLLSNLCAHKAGLPADAWKQGAELYVFTADVFEEPGGAKHGT